MVIYVNTSSKTQELNEHITFHAPRMKVGAKCILCTAAVTASHRITSYLAMFYHGQGVGVHLVNKYIHALIL